MATPVGFRYLYDVGFIERELDVWLHVCYFDFFLGDYMLTFESNDRREIFNTLLKLRRIYLGNSTCIPRKNSRKNNSKSESDYRLYVNLTIYIFTQSLFFFLEFLIVSLLHISTASLPKRILVVKCFKRRAISLILHISFVNTH